MSNVFYEPTYSRLSLSTVWVSAIFSGALLLIAASFQKYFFFAPSGTNPTLGVFQSMYMVGFALLVLAPPAIFAFVPKPGRVVKSIIIVVVSVLPFAAIASHVTLGVSYGNPYLNYLAAYPVLFASHVIIPVAYILICSLRTSKKAA